MQAVRLRFLGTPQIVVGDQVVDQLPAKALAVLAYLSLAPQTPRERLMGLLWAESSAEAARKNLRNTLWTIRRALGEAAIQARGDRLALDPAIWTDTRAFEQLTQQHLGGEHPDTDLDGLERHLFALYAGPLLDGVEVLEAPEFELWLTSERERLRQLDAQLLQHLLQGREAYGAWAAVIRAAQHALALDPFQEPIYRSRMAAHARLGERGEALRQYDLLRATLARELGVEPLPETEAVRSAIVAGAIRATEPARVPAPRRAPPLPILGDTPAAPFVGRQEELATLDRALVTVQHQHARAVLITGEGGIGKTRLWDAWSAQVPADITILTTSCTEALAKLPLLPLAELLRNNPAMRRLLRQESPLAPIWLAELTRLLPELRAAYPDLPAPTALPAGEDRLVLFEALVQCLRALGDGPAIVFIDDLHWADRATVDWLAYAMRRMGDAPLLLIATARADEMPEAAVNLATQWGRFGVLERVTVRPLNAAETAALLAAHAVDPAIVERVQAQSAGNPYFAIELARAGSVDVPLVLADLLRGRLARLPVVARQVAQAAHVLQPTIDVATLRRTSGRSEEETLDALDALVRAHVLEERGGRYVFTHPLLATVVRDELSGAREMFLHRRAAEALEAIYAGELAPYAGQLAHHYSRAQEPARAARFAELAGDQALTLAAPREAVQFYTQAMRCEPTAARQLRLARALERSGALAEAIAAYQAVLRMATAQDVPVIRARACLGIADVALSAGQTACVVSWARQGLGCLNEAADLELRALGSFLLGAGLLRTRGATEDAAAALTRAAQLANAHELTGIAARSQFELGNLRAQQGDLRAARQRMADAVDRAQEARDPFQETLAHNNAAYYALQAGDLADAQRHVASGQALADTWGLEVPRQWLDSTHGEIALAESRWDDAEACFRQGMAVAERFHNREQVANYQANLALVARGRGDLHGAIALLEQTREEASDLGAAYLQARIDVWLAESYVAAGEHTAAAAARARVPAERYPLLQQQMEHARRESEAR